MIALDASVEARFLPPRAYLSRYLHTYLQFSSLGRYMTPWQQYSWIRDLVAENMLCFH